MFLLLLIFCVKSLLYEKSDLMNQSQKAEVVIDQDVKESIQDNVHFEFTFVFPTIINFYLNNRTMNSSNILEVAKQETRIGVLICQDFQLSIHNISIELKSLPQYQNKSYKYDIRTESAIKYLTRNLVEVGFSKSQQIITYYINMGYETSGIYEIKIDFIYGSGNMSLQTCINQNCSNQLGEQKIFLNYIQSHCIEIDKFNLKDVCYYVLEINTSGKSHYALSLVHSTTPQIQMISENTVVEINLQNQEAFITLSNLQKNDFLYFNTEVKGLFYCGDQREPFASNLIAIKNDQCQKQYDLDQNLYLQHQSKNLIVQYINSVTKLAMNSKQRVSQQANIYQFFSIETIFQEFIFDIFVYDYPLWVQIYFSNTTQFPNEQTHQLELIESNFKNFRLENNYKLFIGIKTKNQSIEYDISIKEPILQFLNIQEEKTFNYCRTCQIEYKYQSQETGFVFMHISFLEQTQYNPDFFKIFFISDGNILKPSSIIVLSEQVYARWTFYVETGLVYTVLTKSEIQQKIKILLTDQRVLRIKNNQQLITISDYKEEVFIIDQQQGKKLFFFFSEIPENLEIHNLFGLCNVLKIAENYFEIQFQNNKKEDSVTYFTINSLIPGPMKLRILQKEYHYIKQISEKIFKSQMHYQFQANQLTIYGQFINCSNVEFIQLKEQFHRIHSTIQIVYENTTTLQFQDHTTFQDSFQQTLDIIQVGPFQDITLIKLIIEFVEEGQSFKFNLNVPISQMYINLQISNKPKIFKDTIVYLFIIMAILLVYLTIKIFLKKKANVIHKRKCYREKQQPAFYDFESKIEEESEMISQFE